MSNSPYNPPHGQPNPVAAQSMRAGTPGVIQWFKVYCVLMAILYAVCLIAGIGLILFAPELAQEDAEMNDPIAFQIMGGLLILMSIGLGILFGIGAFLPRRKWAWIFGFVPICIGFTSICTLLICIPLLIFWMRADNKAYFGMT